MRGAYADESASIAAVAACLPVPLPRCCAATAQAQQVVKIGFASPLTGPQAHYGTDNRNGAQMAIDELNAREPALGGKPVKFELVAEDDQADPKTGTIVAQRLVDAGIRGMVGHFNSGVTIPASRIYHDAGIPQLSVSTNAKYTRQGYRTAFRADGRRRQAGRRARRVRGAPPQAEAPRRRRRSHGLRTGSRRRLRSRGQRRGRRRS